MKTSEDKRASLEQFSADARWFDTHRKDLVAEYPDQWIGVFQRKVVGASDDIEDLVIRLQAKDLPVGSIYVDFAATKSKAWII